MYVLYCHTTQHFFRTSVGISLPVTFTNHTHCFILKNGQMNTATARICKGTHSEFSPVTHIHTQAHVYCCLMRQIETKKSHACFHIPASTNNKNNTRTLLLRIKNNTQEQDNVIFMKFSQMWSPLVWLVLQQLLCFYH